MTFDLMKQRSKNIILNSIAILFLITFCWVIISFLRLGDYSAFLWVCYISIPIIIFGLLKRNSNIILSQLVILAIPDLLWIFDFFYFLITGNVLIGATTFPKGSLIDKIRSLQHLYIVPLSLFALSIIKLKRNYKVLFFTLIEIALIFLLTIFVTPSSANINCIYKNCINIPLNFLPYTFIWFGLLFIFITISYFIITSLPFIRKK